MTLSRAFVLVVLVFALPVGALVSAACSAIDPNPPDPHGHPEPARDLLRTDASASDAAEEESP